MSGARGDPDYVKEQCKLSLWRLGVDYIDLYYLHRCGLQHADRNDGRSNAPNPELNRRPSD